MTVKQMADVAGVSRDTVLRKIKEMYPDLIKNGVKTVLKQKEAIEVMKELRKKNFIAPMQNEKLPQQKAEVDRLDRLERMVENLVSVMAEMPKMIMQQNQLLEIKQDYFTIRGYTNKLGITITFSEAQNFGKQASALSKELNKEIRKAEDERFGYVNSYSEEVLKQIFILE